MRLRRCAPAFTILLLCVLHLQASPQNVPSDTWQRGGVLSTARTGATATLMADGRILIVGGKDGNGNALATAEVFNPDGTTAPVLSMSVPRYGHSAMLLYDGSVLVAGGHTSGSGVVNSAELFDPVANTWRLLPNTMADSRADFTLSQLIDGNVLAVGGDNGSGPVSSVEKLDLLTGVFQYQSSLITGRTAHTASVLKDGRVLVVGGSAVAPDGSRIALNSTEIYDPNLTFISAGPTLNVRRYAHSATTLIDGTILLAGGNNGTADLASVEIYDPVANTFSLSSASLLNARSRHVALLLPNNNSVLIVGGTSSGSDLSSTELYQSWNSTMLANPPMTAARLGAAGSALQADGAALIAGGSGLDTTELYGFATVKTDKLDYAPGTPVQITGSGWKPGETVTLTLLESPNIDQHPAMTAIADSLGNISNSDFAPDIHDINLSFYLTAVGTQSQAQTTFTDKPVPTVTIQSHLPSPSVVGQSVVFVVTVVAPGNVSAGEGCLQILDNGSQVGATTQITSGTSFSFTVPFTSIGAHSVLANYLDSGTGASTCPSKGNSFDGTTSSPVTQTVKAASATSLVTSGSPTPLGQSVTFTATLSAVSPATGTPTGSVTFYDGVSGATCSALGSSILLGAQAASVGSASLSTSALSVGSHTILACYAGDSNFGDSGASVSQTINKVTPTINWSNPATVTYGTALGSTQLNATATYQNGGTPVTVPGTFTYTPAAGTVLNAGNSQTLSVHLVPTDTASFNTPADKTVSINVQAKSVTANITTSNKVYDGTTAATFTCSLSGVLAADTGSVTCTGGSASFASAGTGTGITVTATGLALSGSGASNYTLSSSSSTTTANITPKNLTITGVAANDKVYDGTTTAALNLSGATLQGIVGSDHVNLQTGSASGSFADKNIGTAKAVIASGFGISGAESSNYTLSQPTGLTANITPKPITVTGITANDKVYDGTSAATLNSGSASLTGIVAGDTVTLGTSGATGTFADKIVGNGKTVTVSGLTISGSSSGNYSLSQPTTTASITPKPLTVTGISANNKTYDGSSSASLNTSAASLAGIVSGDTVTLGTSGASGTFADKNVGNNTPVTVAGLTIAGVDSGNYSISQPTTSASITPKPLTITGVSATNKTYDGSASASLNTTTASLVGVVTGDTVALGTSGGSGTFADKNVGSNKPVTVVGLTIAGVDAGNYSLSQPAATANITPKPITVTGIAANDRVYDGTNAATLNTGNANIAGIVSGDTVTLGTSGATSTFADKNVGNNKPVTIAGLTIAGVDAGNYSLSQPTTTASITPKPLTVTGVSATSKTYDGSTNASLNAAAASLVGVVSADTVTLNVAGATGTFADKNVGNSKPVTVAGLTITGVDAGNYSLSQPTTSASITPKPLTVTGVSANSKTYDGSTDASLNTAAASLVGVVSGDTVTLNAAGATGTFPDKNVSNNKPVTVAGLNIAGVDAGNYSLSQPTTSASIAQKPLTVTGVSATNKTYDGSTSAPLNTAAASLAGVVSGDIVAPGTSGATGTFANKNVGNNKPVTVAGLTITGVDSGNYSLSQPTATASITPKLLTVSGITTPDKVYDGTTVATLNLASGSLQGLIAGDVVTLSTAAATGSFADKNVASTKMVSISGLTITGTDAANYSLSQPTATASITPKLITVAGITANNKTYDGTAAATLNLGSVSLQGTVAGDTVSPITTAATGSFADKNVGTGKTVTIAGVALNGSDASNYSLTQPAATADITPKTLTPTVTVQNKVYDGTASGTIASQSLTGVIGQDVVSLVAGAATFPDKNVGIGKAVTINGLSLSGSDAGNYSVSNLATTTADITPRALHVTAAGSPKTYDGNVVAVVTLHDDRVSGDVLADSYTSATFIDKNVGTGKTISVAGISMAGADANNYSPINASATATADITARVLTVSATADDKIYDGNATANAHLSDNRVSGDSLAETYTAAAFSDKTVGVGKAVTVTGISISGGDAGNYGLGATTATATASITARPLHVTATGQPRKYDGTTTAIVTLSDDRLPADMFTDSYLSASFADKNVGTGKPMTVAGISISGTDAVNYAANTSTTTTATITQRPVTISAVADSKTYDATVTSSAKPTLSGDGVALGDAESSSQTFDTKNVGTSKTLTPTGTIQDGNGGANYQVTFVAGHGGSITPRPLTVSATGVSKQYDGLVLATVTLTDDRLAGDTLTDSYTGASFADKNVGTNKTISVAGISISGSDAANYGPVNSTATASADIAARALTVSASGVNKTYDGNTTATVQLSDDRLAGDSLADSYGSATFDSKNVGTGKTVSVSGISVSGSDAGNYNLANTTASTTANISARHLTVTATGVDKSYDGTTTATVTLSDDRLTGDILSDSYSSASFSDKNVGSGKTVTVTGIAISGADAANYSANPNTATTASISTRKLTVTAAGVAKVYDGTTLAAVTLSDDRLSGDLFTDTDASATFSDKNVGTAKTVSVSGIIISGIDAANYSPINATATTTADITPRSLTVSAIASDRPYDGTTSASVTLNDNRVQSDALTDAFVGAMFSDKNAGVAKTVTVTGISISGVDVGNYVLGNTTASTTADITARAIEVTGTSDSKTYDATTASSKSPSITVGSLVTGDNATYTQVFDSKNAGTRSLLPSIVIADGNNGHNYSVIFHNVNGTISPLTIAGSITVSDKTYDGTTTATIANRTLSGVLANEVVSYTGGTATFSDSNAGLSKTVTAVGLYLAGVDAGNYTVNSTATTTATIAKANQQISWSAPAPIVFGTSLGNTQLNATVTGVQGGTAPGTLTYTPAAGTILGVGTRQLRVDATSTTNYNAATATVSINVNYSTGACLGDLGHSILQPINADGSSTFKQGSTVPAKFRVCDVAGHSIGTAGVVTSFYLVQTIRGTVSETVDEAVISTTPDASFRWDSTSQQWIFNVSTKPLLAQTTYVYSIGLNDGSTIFFRYGLPK